MGNSKMNARERIDYLFDDHSFVEVGGYVSARNTDYNLGANKVEGDGVITGYGVINDRMVYVYSQDVSALGGSVGEMHAKKICRLYDLAMKMGAPVIGLIDCPPSGSLYTHTDFSVFASNAWIVPPDSGQKISPAA